MRITESKLRQIIREEARRLVEMGEYAPGVAGPQQPGLASEELSMMLDAMEQGVDDRLEELGYDCSVASPEERQAAFDGNGLEVGPDEVYDIPSIAEAYEEYVGMTVGGIESLTDGSMPPRIVGFEYTDRACVVLDTDHGTMTLCLDDLRMY